MNLKPAWIRTALLTLFILTASGCAAQRVFNQANERARRDDWDAAVLGYSRAVGLDPGNERYEAALLRAKLKASAVHFERGKRYLEANQLELAITELEETIFLDSQNQYAKAELDKARDKLEKLRATPSEIEAAKREAAKKSLAPPKLSPSSNQPIVVKFKDKEVGQIYDAISKLSGINFLYDDKLDLKKKGSVDLAGLTFERAMDVLMLQFKHFYKIIDEHTLLIADDNRQKRTELEDKVIRTFFLSNGDTKQVNTLLRSLLDVRKIAENPQLNSITLKESPDTVAVAEKIIDANDKAKAELIIDVELLEIDRTLAQTLGLDLSSKNLSLSFLGGAASLPLNNLSSLRQQGNWTIGTIPGVIINFLKSDSDTKTLSKPQIRVTEGEKAEVHIGDRVPIPTTTFNTSNTVGGTIVPVTSFTYQNTGIQLSIEPRVHHNKEVTLKLNVEISSVSGQVAASGGISQPIIGTRQIQTVVRLKDGETNLLSGLVNEVEKDAISGVPGLSSIPGLKRLFSSTDSSRQTLDIVLTITPHIIRVPDITEDDLEAIWVGTEDNTRLRLPAKNALGETPFGGGEAEAAAAGAGTTAGTPAAQTPAATTRPAASPATPAQAPVQTQPPPAPAPVPTPAPSAPVNAPSAPSTAAPTPPAGGAEDEEEDWGDEEEEPEAGQGQPSPSPPPEKPVGIAQVILAVPKNTYRVGETVVVQVQMIGATNIGSVPFHLQYDKNVLDFVPPGIEGNFLNNDGTSTVFVAQEVQGGGEIVVGDSRVGSGSGANGSGLLATFQFRAKAPGSCAFSFTGSSVRDPNANNLPSAFTAAVINVAAK